MCHALLALPLLALPLFWLLPMAVAAPLYAAAVALALLTYGYALRALRMPCLNGEENMLCAIGTVVQIGNGDVTVLVLGEHWRAGACGEIYAVGERVEIAGIDRPRFRIRKRSAARRESQPAARIRA